MGKLLFNPATNSYNTGFIKGLFHQLEFLEDLRGANKSIEALEKSITKAEGAVQRFVDVVADGRRFELKNFTHYGKVNQDAIVGSLQKEISIAKKIGGDANAIIDEIKKSCFVIRGAPDIDPGNAKKMIEKMKEAGLNELKGSKFRDVRKYFIEQMDKALAAVDGNLTKIIPELDDLIVFQGKGVPF